MREELEKIIATLEEDIRELCVKLGIRDLTKSPYYTIAISPTAVNIKGKSYERLQLKGYIGEQKKVRSETIKSWKKEDAPVDKLTRLINLYRAFRYLTKARDLLPG